MMHKRTRKLLRLRRRMRICQVGQVGGLALAAFPLVKMALGGAGELGAAWNTGILPDSLGVSVALVGAGLVGAYATARLYRKDKDKYDALRRSTHALLLLADPICTCGAPNCACKQTYLTRMDAEQDINLAY